MSPVRATATDNAADRNGGEGARVGDALTVTDLSVDYHTSRGRLQALRSVDLAVPAGRIVGVVGESGCGKSTLIGAILRLLSENAEITSGAMHLGGRDLASASEADMRTVRGRDISVVFQDPMTGLNPVLTIGRQMTDIQHREPISRAEKRARAVDMLGRVGIPDPAARLSAYPHAFSGGMRQRVAIAMALMMRPSLLIADEPTTALDATLEVQIIHLLKDLQADIGCAILFISHHLGVIAELCDRVVVMYAGEAVEEGPVRAVFHTPAHPYTRMLFECDPGRIRERRRALPSIAGDLPNLIHPPAGCVFRERCDRATGVCAAAAPSPVTVAPDHWALCHHATAERGGSEGRTV